MKVEKYIMFINETLGNMDALYLHDREWYQREIEKIKKRAKNPYLNVALIGDFSSGKSTFINALIKQDILKTAWTATTAVPTHIYQYNKQELSITVETTEGKCYSLRQEEGKENLEKIIGKKIPEDQKDQITFLSTSNDLTEYIKNIMLYVPGNQEMEKICIIDTPGVNPGASGTESHVTAARNVLREYADATIILFKASQVYTHSFEQFLRENAKHFMDEAVFVITFFDLIDEDERDEVKEFVRFRLEEVFGLSDPTVYCCSAKYANGQDGSEEGQMWSRAFDKLRTDIIQYIGWRREIILHRQTAFLLQVLMTEIEKEVQKNMSDIKEQLDILEENSIKNLEEELEVVTKEHKEDMERSYRQIGVENEYKKMFDRMKDTAARKIRACTKMHGNGSGAIGTYIKHYLPQDIKRQQEQTSDYLAASFGRLARKNETYYNRCGEMFQRYNLALEQMDEKQDVKMEYDSIKQEFQIGPVNILSTGQAVAEIAIVLASLPVLVPCAIVDEIFGSNIGDAAVSAVDWLANLPSWLGGLEKNKTKAIAEVMGQLSSLEKENKSAYLEENNKNKQQLLQAADKIQKTFVDEYKKIYEKRTRQYEVRKRRLEQETKECEGTLVKTRKYLDELKQERKK